MWKDPIVEEVRDAAKELFAPFEGDVKRIGDYLRECQKEHPHRVAKRTALKPHIPKDDNEEGKSAA